MSNNLPDRPIPEFLKVVRSLIRLKRKIIIKLKLRKKISWGRGINFGKDLELRPPQFMEIGDHVSIGPWFLTEVNTKIGSDVLISSKVSFIGNDHAFDNPDKTIFFSGRLPSSIVILEGDNLIGYGTIVVGNVTIGKGCIVGAGSVVTKDLPSYYVCAGVPARPIKKRYSV
jgi:acetyltransferase-like isoleucine patch superfamily enzyme